jgi:hypothetical protein
MELEENEIFIWLKEQVPIMTKLRACLLMLRPADGSILPALDLM